MTTFAQRLNQACDNLDPIVPPLGQGRQVFISRRLNVTQEAVRKWFGGGLPRPAKMRALARLLDVDVEWLAFGIEPEMGRRAKRAHGEKTEGAIYALFGILTMAGGRCAFPDPKDPRGDYVDLYTIVRGVQTAIHVSVGRQTGEGEYEFCIPPQHGDVRCIGVVHAGGTRMDLIDLQNDLIEAHKQRKNASFVVMIDKQGASYHTKRTKWPRVRSVDALL